MGYLLSSRYRTFIKHLNIDTYMNDSMKTPGQFNIDKIRVCFDMTPRGNGDRRLKLIYQTDRRAYFNIK